MEPEIEAKFVIKYGRDVVDNGYEEFAELAKKRKKALEDLHHFKAKQDQAYAEFNKLNRTNKKFDYESFFKEHNQEFDEKEAEVAKKWRHNELEKDNETIKEKQFQKFKKQFPDLDKASEKTNETHKKDNLNLDTKQEEFLEFKKQFQSREEQEKIIAKRNENQVELEAKQKNFVKAINVHKEGKKLSNEKQQQDDAREEFVRKMKSLTDKTQELER